MMNKKKRFSLYIGVLSAVLILTWVSLVFIEAFETSKRNQLKDISEQKITFNLDNRDHIVPPIKGYIGILVEDSNNLGVDKLVDALPESISFGISIYDENLANNLKSLKNDKRDYLVKIPLFNHSDQHNGALDLCPGISAIEIKDRIEQIHNKAGGSGGFYSLGEKEQFLDYQSSLEVLINKVQDLGVVLVYGIHYQTSILEIDGGNSLIKAFDLSISSQNADEVLKGLKASEDLAIKKGEAIIALSASHESLDVLLKWYSNAKKEGIKFVPVSELISKKNV